jgi:hypothetical protein
VDGLRLTGGRTIKQGQPEVLVGGTWGALCMDESSSAAHTVICRHLGFSGEAALISAPMFNRSRLPFTVKVEECLGSKNLDDCTLGVDPSSCNPVLGVACNGELALQQ